MSESPNKPIHRLTVDRARVSPAQIPLSDPVEGSPVSDPPSSETEIDLLVLATDLQPFGTAQAFVDQSLWDGEQEVDAFLEWVSQQRDQATL
mgnify:CR=1 FL=1